MPSPTSPYTRAHSLRLAAHFAARGIALRYRRTIIGVGWTLVAPTLAVLVIGTVYSSLFGRSFDEFVPFLFGGIMPFQFFADVAVRSCSVIAQSAGMARQTLTPLAVFPMALIMSAFLVFLCGFAVIIVILIVAGSFHPFALLAVIPGFLALGLLASGVALLHAILGALFKDYQYLIGILLRLAFFATPIIYPPEMMDRLGRSWIYEYNPLHYTIQSVRGPLLTGELPPIHHLGIALGFAMGIAILGYAIFRKVDRRILMYV